MARIGLSRSGRTAVAALAAVAILALALAGCSSSPKPAKVSGNIAASATVNPSVSKRPSPVLVRVYELKAATGFNNADFISLYQRDQAELGADIVSREEFTLAPGEKRPWNKTLSADTRFIAVFAAYRDLERAQWRNVVAVPPGKALQLSVQADELAVTTTLKKP